MPWNPFHHDKKDKDEDDDQQRASAAAAHGAQRSTRDTPSMPHIETDAVPKFFQDQRS